MAREVVMQSRAVLEALGAAPKTGEKVQGEWYKFLRGKGAPPSQARWDARGNISDVLASEFLKAVRKGESFGDPCVDFERDGSQESPQGGEAEASHSEDAGGRDREREDGSSGEEDSEIPAHRSASPERPRARAGIREKPPRREKAPRKDARRAAKRASSDPREGRRREDNDPKRHRPRGWSASPRQGCGRGEKRGGGEVRRAEGGKRRGGGKG